MGGVELDLRQGRVGAGGRPADAVQGGGQVAAAAVGEGELGHLSFSRREVVTVEALTEQRIIPQPVVYGFLRLPAGALPRADALRHALTEYCARHELALGGVFTEHTTLDAGPAAFAALLDASTVPGGYGVVIPSSAHLGPRQRASARADEIRRTGAVVISLRDSAQSPPPLLPRPARRYAMPTLKSLLLGPFEADFPAVVEAVGRTRRITAEHVRRRGPAGEREVIEKSVLLVSELVTNAVVHSDGCPGLLRIEHHDEELLIAVTDGSLRRPTLRSPAVNEERGRGLVIVEALARDRGVDRGATTKTTWCTIAIPRGAA
ncbi:ATP-binding protein [Streptomyces sp. NPDC048057]|uniref:ATP-binding protein n=1 Tax=Streptomyces sp. NPDC048057 TaxID=3155628 RepID=UPI0033D58E5D